MSISHPNSGLPDYLVHGLSILFVGINTGLRSAEVGHHFAGPSNRFWKLLFDASLIPFAMTYQDDWQLPEFGYGLTNLIARPTAGVQDLGKQDFLAGHQALLTKITTYQPRLVALLGVSMARMLLLSKEATRVINGRWKTLFRSACNLFLLVVSPSMCCQIRVEEMPIIPISR